MQRTGEEIKRAVINDARTVERAAHEPQHAVGEENRVLRDSYCGTGEISSVPAPPSPPPKTASPPMESVLVFQVEPVPPIVAVPSELTSGPTNEFVAETWPPFWTVSVPVISPRSPQSGHNRPAIERKSPLVQVEPGPSIVAADDWPGSPSTRLT